MADYDERKFEEVLSLVGKGNTLDTACYSSGIEPRRVRSWIKANRGTCGLKYKQAKARFITELRSQMLAAPPGDKRNALARELAAHDPSFARSVAQQHKRLIEQEDKERDKALEQTLGRVDYGFAGWKLKKRDGVRKLKAGNLDEKALKTIWSWSLAGEDKKDIKERYDFEQRILGNATKQSMKQVAEKIKALMVGRNKMSKDEERLLTEKIVTAKKTKSPYKLKDSNGGVIELPAIELEWKQEKKKTVRRKKKTRR